MMREKLLGRFRKDDMVALVNSSTECFDETLDLATQNIELVSWRAAWVLFHSMKRNDQRFFPFIHQMIMAIPGKNDGHQREILRIIEQLEVPEEHEGVLFDLCMTIWEQTGRIPSLRLFAFRTICRIASKYPELKSELSFITQSHYTDSLSPGIRRAVQSMAGENR